MKGTEYNWIDKKIGKTLRRKMMKRHVRVGWRVNIAWEQEIRFIWQSVLTYGHPNSMLH